MKILKFGGKSLSNGASLSQVLSIIEQRNKETCNYTIVLSARADTTDRLENLLEKARLGSDRTDAWNDFKLYQKEPANDLDYTIEFDLLEKIFEGISLIGDYSLKTKDLVLAQGELLAIKLVTHLLNKRQIESIAVDSRRLFVTDSKFGNAHVVEDRSLQNTIDYFDQFPDNTLPIVTGFIASDIDGNTTTLGRNGSNYSASLLAKYLEADEVQNFTHVNGIYTANPDKVSDAKIIDHLSFQEASELASFGASILHAKTILPLVESSIPLRILNTNNPDGHGTLIGDEKEVKGVKSLTVKSDVCIINMEGKGLLGKKGIDGRVFNRLSLAGINIGIISQGSSERGVSLVVDEENANTAIDVLNHEFRVELKEKDISRIFPIHDISVITVIGQSLMDFASSFQSLAHRNIEVLLINNTINGKNIGLVIENKYVDKAIEIIHNKIFEKGKSVNIAVFGKGTVGSVLIDQIINQKETIERASDIRFHIFAIVSSNKILFSQNGFDLNWRKDFDTNAMPFVHIDQVLNYSNEYNYENLIAVDNTASVSFVDNYIPLVKSGFDLVSANKIANTLSYDSYQTLRSVLKEEQKSYLFETNVGAGLPLIDTIQLLQETGEQITRIKGVFSGSLSYIFNEFSNIDVPFSSVLKEAMAKGFTEPDPREDLCGNDVARKLLILARVLGLKNEMNDIQIENLIPIPLRKGTVDQFQDQLELIDDALSIIKNGQKEDHVLRYVGDFQKLVDRDKGALKVELVSVSRSSALGQLSGSDNLIEIYTKSYGDNPIVIRGAGAGAAVTARGVFGDLWRIAKTK